MKIKWLILHVKHTGMRWSSYTDNRQNELKDQKSTDKKYNQVDVTTIKRKYT